MLCKTSQSYPSRARSHISFGFQPIIKPSQTGCKELAITEARSASKCVGVMLMLCPAGLAFYILNWYIWIG
jgi:hypothetical protein